MGDGLLMLCGHTHSLLNIQLSWFDFVTFVGLIMCENNQVRLFCIFTLFNPVKFVCSLAFSILFTPSSTWTLVTVVYRLASRGCEPLCGAHSPMRVERHLSVPSSARRQKPVARLLLR